MGIRNIEIRKIKKLKGGWVKFDVGLVTNNFGTIVIKGFRANESIKNAKIWVQEPSYQTFNQYYRCVFFEERAVWEEIESLIISEYQKAKSEGDWEENLDYEDFKS